MRKILFIWISLTTLTSLGQSAFEFPDKKETKDFLNWFFKNYGEPLHIETCIDSVVLHPNRSLFIPNTGSSIQWPLTGQLAPYLDSAERAHFIQSCDYFIDGPKCDSTVHLDIPNSTLSNVEILWLKMAEANNWCKERLRNPLPNYLTWTSDFIPETVTIGCIYPIDTFYFEGRISHIRKHSGVALTYPLFSINKDYAVISYASLNSGGCSYLFQKVGTLWTELAKVDCFSF